MFPLPYGERIKVRGPDIKRKNVSLARGLRSNSTDAERLLWNCLRSRAVEDLKFRRQYPVGDYIADFVCLEKHVVIELDGGQHNENEQDVVRDAWLVKNGYKVVRIWNNELFDNINGVVERIQEECVDPSPQPSPRGGEGVDNATDGK